VLAVPLLWMALLDRADSRCLIAAAVLTCPALLELDNTPTMMVDSDYNKVYTISSTKATYAAASAACASEQPVPGVVMKGTLWVVNGFSEHTRVEIYFRDFNPSIGVYW
jgi:hypothetical protein